MFLNVILLLPTPLITMYLIDNVLPKQNISLLSLICSGIIFLLMIKGVTSFLQNLYFLRFNEKVIFDIQLDLFERIQIYPTYYRQKKQTGYLMSRIKDDPNRLHGLFANTGLAIVRDILTFIAGLSILFYLHLKLALMSVAILPFFIYTMAYFSGKIRQLSVISFEKNALVSKKIEESISILDTFKIYTAEKFDAIRFVGSLKSAIRSFIKKNLTGSLLSVLTGFIGGLGPIVVIWYGMAEIMRGNLTLGELIAFNSFIGYMFGPAGRLINMNISIQQSLAAWDRIYEILSDKDEVLPKSKGTLKVSAAQDICFKNVTFAYNNEPVLNEINLIIRKGTIVGLVGESGSGKSTLASLIPALNTPQNGEIYIGKEKLKECDIKYLRSQIAVVDQEPALFHDTVYNNIRLGNRRAKQNEIYNAAKQARIHDYIMTLPHGYDTMVDEKGLSLSVGQKQRIAIARAILRDPAIFIMDEPTSGLDANTEEQIFAALRPFMQKRTTIIIAHRLSTVVSADVIIVIDKGRIVEIGAHDELLANGSSYYRKLWEKQHSMAVAV